MLAADRWREVSHARNLAITKAGEALLGRALRGADRQAGIFSNAKVVLGELARSLPVGDSPVDCRQRFREVMAELLWIQSLSVVSPSGDFTCSEPEYEANVTDRPYFVEAMALGTFVISDYLVSRRTGEPIIVAAMPRVTGEAAGGVLLAGLDLNWLGRVAVATENGAPADVIIFDRRGTVIAAPGFSREQVGRSYAGTPLWDAVQSETGIADTEALDGVSRLVAWTRMPSTQGVLVASLPSAAVVGPIDADARFSLAMLALAFAAGAVIIWYGGERLAIRPSLRLAAAAERLGTGDLDSRIDTSGFGPEFRLVGDTFNAMADKLGKQAVELRRFNQHLAELASRDGLTELINRRTFEERLKTETTAAARSGRPLAMAIADIDFFKRFNDGYGYLAADRALVRIAGVLRRVAERLPGTLAARLGGDEFALLIPGARPEEAAALAERLRREIAELAIVHYEVPEGQLTISIGLASFAALPAEASAEMLSAAADAALTRAKRLGRNRVVDNEPEAQLLAAAG